MAIRNQRLSGEEFAILLSSTDQDGARGRAERICDAICALELDSGRGTTPVTASFGIAKMLPTDRAHSDCMARADSALHQAKSDGRNRVVEWREEGLCAG